MSHTRFEVQDRPEESRYVLIDRGTDGSTQDVIGEESYVDVDADGAIQRVLFHTGVSEDYAGQGLASVLVRAAVEDVIGAGYAVVPVCPYVAAWLPKHPEYADSVVKPTPAHFRAVKAVTVR
ncbi:GNAT family N-acetyltransferase [Arthrobacter celericrescens]|uniref:GNAT family N-acetyltransferase n=1 Tax=Arthrobacter celericrescens TaxID=2320851 RepID=UPI000EA2DE2F|nr:GNAT family N-acetyltransferase [Arthrobacter celericrescens]